MRAIWRQAAVKSIVVHLLCLLKKSALCADLIQTSFCSTEVSTVLFVEACTHFLKLTKLFIYLSLKQLPRRPELSGVGAIWRQTKRIVVLFV